MIKTFLQKLFPNVEQRILKCYNKRIILKVNKSKHVKTSFLYLVISFECSDFTPPQNIDFLMFSGDTKWKHGGRFL